MEKVLSVDADLCTGCRSCEAICSLVHEGVCSPRFSRIAIETWGEVAVHIPMICQRCIDPVCEQVCPTKARKEDAKTGAVITDEAICVGCESCVYACPYAAPKIHPLTGKTITCDLCDGEPQCVSVCTAGALSFIPVERVVLQKRRRAGSPMADQFRFHRTEERVC
ncbi:MAG: 4Fe-4S dicluster domain-containing protein [bacterium]